MDKPVEEEGQAPEPVEPGELTDEVLGVVSGGVSAKEAPVNISFN